MTMSKPFVPAPAALVWLLYHVISSPPFCSGAVRSTNFVRLEDRGLVCNSSLVALTPALVDQLSCARACREQPDCPMFVFDTSSYDPHTDLGVGTCSQCPADGIIAVNFTVDLIPMQGGTWQNILSVLINPPNSTFLAVPGALSLGRLLIITGRTPEVLPDRFTVDIYANDQSGIAVRVAPRFNFHSIENRVAVSSRMHSTFSVKLLPPRLFTFAAGQNFEICVLAANDGFHVYIDRRFMWLLDKTTFMMGDIGFVFFEKTEVNTILF